MGEDGCEVHAAYCYCCCCCLADGEIANSKFLSGRQVRNRVDGTEMAV